jgi:hypothetical protein
MDLTAAGSAPLTSWNILRMSILRHSQGRVYGSQLANDLLSPNRLDLLEISNISVFCDQGNPFGNCRVHQALNFRVPHPCGFCAGVGSLAFHRPSAYSHQIVLISLQSRIFLSLVTRAIPSAIAVAPIRRSLGSLEYVAGN